ncbi:MAG: dockerin type I domain-containing protein [Planctomycetota bacterium]|jgi:hypothetical protein
MKGLRLMAVAALCCCVSTVTAADLTLSIACESPVSDLDPVADITITAELDTAVGNDGLALFGFDGSVSGGVVNLDTAALLSAGADAGPFVDPVGLNNPGGYDGTPSGDDLLQLGGGQDTIGNAGVAAPAPTGPVVTNIAHPGSAAELFTGTITFPGEGIYTVTIDNGFANVITGGPDPNDVYTVESVGTVVSDSCQVVVEAAASALIASSSSCSLHGATEWCLDLTPPNVEPRFAGITKLELTMDGSVSSIGATVDCGGGEPSVTPTADGSALVTIDFGGPLPDVSCCTLTLSGDSTDTIDLITLSGDVSLDGTVTVSDASLIKAKIGNPVDASNFIFDVTGDDSISISDRSLVKPKIGNSAPACPP